MAKTVTFDAKEVLGKEYTVIDSNKNIKIVSKGMRNLLEAIDNYENKQAKEEKPVTVIDYVEIIDENVIAETGKLLGLTKTETAKLEDMSYSDVFKFYSKVVNDFLAMKVPDPTDIQNGIKAMNEVANEEKDPKSKEDK